MFCSVYGTLPFNTISFGGFSSFDGSGNLFDLFPIILEKLVTFVFILFSCNSFFPFTTPQKKKKKLAFFHKSKCLDRSFKKKKKKKPG